MKITPKDILVTTIDQNIGKTADKSSTDQNFGKILKEKMSYQPVSSNPQSFIPPLDGVSMIALQNSDGISRAETRHRINEFLDLLDEYQNRMDDPESTLKQAYPLISRMETETKNLMPVLESLPEGDGLRDVLNRLLVTSTVEVIKFNRGDYLN